MASAHRRHDITDNVWALLEPHLPGREGVWVDERRIIEDLSMRCFGFYARERPGGICLRTMVDGATPIAVLSAGATRAFGNDYWSNLSMRPTLNGSCSTPVTSKSIRMRRAQKEAIRTWPAQNGAQHQNTPGRGCVWSAGPSSYYARYLCGLLTSFPPDGGNRSRASAVRSRV